VNVISESLTRSQESNAGEGNARVIEQLDVLMELINSISVEMLTSHDGETDFTIESNNFELEGSEGSG